MKASGEWSGGDVAALVSAALELDGAHLVVRAADGAAELARWPVSTLRVDAMHEGSLAYIESPDAPGRTVSTTDEGLIDALRRGGARGAGLPRRRRMALGLAFALSIAAVLGGMYAAVPLLARVIAARVPFSVERQLRPQVQAMLASDVCRTPESDAALDALRRRLDPAGAIPADVQIANMPVPNAFALPGGTVLLTRGLVEQAESGEEIAGVLAHELAHVRHRHVLAELIQDTFMSGIWAVSFGDYSGLLVVDPRTVQHLIELRHSRQAEAEADRTAMTMMADARVSLDGLAAFFDRNRSGAAEGALAFLSTHPATEQRLAQIRSAPAVDGPPVLTADQLGALKAACDHAPPPSSFKERLHWPRKAPRKSPER